MTASPAGKAFLYVSGHLEVVQASTLPGPAACHMLASAPRLPGAPAISRCGRQLLHGDLQQQRRVPCLHSLAHPHGGTPTVRLATPPNRNAARRFYVAAPGALPSAHSSSLAQQQQPSQEATEDAAQPDAAQPEAAYLAPLSDEQRAAVTAPVDAHIRWVLLLQLSFLGAPDAFRGPGCPARALGSA